MGAVLTFLTGQDALDALAALGDDAIRVIGVRADDASCIAEAAIGIAANVVSMQEMDPPRDRRLFPAASRQQGRTDGFLLLQQAL